jgi:hypothetical protein
MIKKRKRLPGLLELPTKTVLAIVPSSLFVVQLTCPEALVYTPPFRKWEISNGLRYAGEQANMPTPLRRAPIFRIPR